jgi:lipopolysaccharide transport system permease protein
MSEIEAHTLIIEPGRTERNYWSDLWRYRELFYILAWRDVKVKYKQTAIGVLWSILRPLLTMLVFTVVFSKIAKLPTEGTAPYAILVYAAMLPWQFFGTALTESSSSLVTNSNLISKVYFPRLIVPAAAVISSFVDFLISFIILFTLMGYYKFWPPIQILCLPILLVYVFLVSFSLGLYLTAVNVKYRDFRYIIPFIVQFGLYISPVGFSSNIVPEKYRLLYNLNPMVGVIDSFRWCILDVPFSYNTGMSILMSLLITIVMLLMGIRYFRKTEKTFADII